MEKSNAEIKDDILRFLLPTAKGEETDTIYIKMGKPTKNLTHFDILVREMIAEGGRYFEFFDDGTNIVISMNGLTQQFLEDGGFVAQYEKEVEATRKMNEASLRNSNIEELTEKELKQKIWNNKFALPLSIAGIVIALGTLVWSVLSTSNNVTQEQLNPKIDSIQNRLEQLENGLKQKDKEVEQLREELNKAEMMVRVLETSKKSLK